MWPCKRCLRQEGCLCQVLVALLWGSTCPLLCSSSTRVALLCWLTWTELQNKLISAGSCFCTAWQGRNPVLGLDLRPERKDPPEKVFAFHTNPNLTRSFSGGSVYLAAICRVCCDVGGGTLPQVLCSEKQGVLQPKIMKILYYKVQFFMLQTFRLLSSYSLSYTNAKKYLASRQLVAFPERICLGNNCHNHQINIF